MKNELRSRSSKGNLRSADKSNEENIDTETTQDEGSSTRGGRKGRAFGRQLADSSLNLGSASSRRSVKSVSVSSKRSLRSLKDKEEDSMGAAKMIETEVQVPSSPIIPLGVSTPKSKTVGLEEDGGSSPLNSSQQENQSPRSSPPHGLDEPTQIRFRSDEGFTPPPGAEAPKPHDFDAELTSSPLLPSTRKPLQEVREPSPRIPETPTRRRKHNIWSDSDVNSTPPSAQPNQNSPFFPRTRALEQPDFEIFEDSRNSTPGRSREASSAASTRPRRGKKRLSNGVEKEGESGGELEDSLDVGQEVEPEPEVEEEPVEEETRPKRRRKAAEPKKKGHLATTAELQNLLPKRRNAAATKVLQYATLDSEGNSQDADNSSAASVDSDEDELATTSKTYRRGKKAPAKAPAKGRKRAATTASKTTTEKGGKSKKTYSRRSLPEAETEVLHTEFADESLDLINDEAKEKLKKEAEKFKEIDDWDLEFESVSADTP